MTSSNRQTTGRIGESLAAQALTQRGYEVIERNWRCARGEIDIVACDGDCWAFVEVKTRHGHVNEYPEEAVDERKTKRITRLARIYLAEHDLERVSWRIDVVAIELDRANAVQRLIVIPGVA